MKTEKSEIRAYPAKKGRYKFVKKGDKGWAKAPLFLTHIFHPKALEILRKP